MDWSTASSKPKENMGILYPGMPQCPLVDLFLIDSQFLPVLGNAMLEDRIFI